MGRCDGNIFALQGWLRVPCGTSCSQCLDRLGSAIPITLPVWEGAYTAIVGVANDTTGVGLVQAYLATHAWGHHARDRVSTISGKVVSGAHLGLGLTTGSAANRHQRFSSIAGMIVALDSAGLIYQNWSSLK
jgi:hypothetical protein